MQEFEPWQDGQMDRYRLHATRDPRGNYYTIDYSVAGQWTIKDLYDRHTVVKFAPTPASPSGRTYEFQNLETAIESITIPGFDGQTAKYEFTYQAADVRRGYCNVDGPPQDDKYVAVPLLKKITLYHGTTVVSAYEAEYDLTLFPPAEGTPAEWCRAGTITSLKLPTQATFRWTYGTYRLPTDCRGDFEIDETLGVYSRMIDAPSAGQFASDVDGTWTYLPELTPETGESVQCGTKTFLEPPPGEMTNTVTAPNGDETVNYFSVWPLGRSTGPSGETKDEFGLPLSRRGAAMGATRFISSRVCKGSCDTPANWRRTTYVAYERDSSPRQFDADRRLEASRVVHDDDQGRFVDTEHSNFDGVGHYRTTTTTGDFGSGAVTRTTTTNYNVRDPLVSSSPAVLDTGRYGEEGYSFTLPPVDARWILNTYSSVVSSVGSSSATKYACFDPLTGELRALRILTGATAASTDSYPYSTAAPTRPRMGRPRGS